MIKKFEKSVRCQCKNITNNKICLNRCKTLYLVENKLYCNIHIQYYMNIFAIKIQSLWRGIKQRRMMEVIYKRLPDELQIKILYFVKRDTYQLKYINTLRSLVEKKIADLYYNALNNYYDRKFIHYIINNEKKVLEITKLFIKYYNILSQEYKYNMMKIIKNLSRIINSLDILINMGQQQNEYNKLKNIYLNIEFLIKPNRERFYRIFN